MDFDDVKKQFMPIFLAVVILLQVEINVVSVVMLLMPLLIVSFGIQLKDKRLGFMGLFLFYVISMQLIVVSNIGDFLVVLMQVAILAVPSVLLLNLVLQLEEEKVENVFFSLKKRKKAVIIPLIIVGVILGGFLLVIMTPLGGGFFAVEMVEGQILLLLALSVVCCAPFLI